MKKARSTDEEEMPSEFDLSRSIPNPWFVAVHGAKFVRVIDKDLADVFPDKAAVNRALRAIVQASSEVIPRKTSTKRASNRTKKKSRS